MDPKANLHTAKDFVSAIDLLVDHLEWLEERKDSEAIAKFSPIVERFKDLVRRIAEENLLVIKDYKEEFVEMKQELDSLNSRIKQMESVLDLEIRLSRGEMIKPKGRA